jgi:hypothetical protein
VEILNFCAGVCVHVSMCVCLCRKEIFPWVFIGLLDSEDADRHAGP